MKARHILLPLAITAAVTVTLTTPANAASLVPSGERSFAQSTLEPAYDAAHAGVITYLLTPNKAPNPVKSNPKSWAPIYVPVYPVGSTAASGYNCAHTPVENCPSHGDGVAGAAQAIITAANGFADVYAAGVAGHDHVLDVPGGDDFNIAWEPVLVLFTTADAANEHLVTDSAILAAQARGDVVLIPVASLTFHCSVVPVTLWNKGTPIV